MPSHRLTKLLVFGSAMMVLTPWILCTTTHAELRPEQIAIVAVRGSADSIDIANYYANARKIPTEQICLLDVPPARNLPRMKWETEIRPYIRNWLLEVDPDHKIRCLVTVWDVPLKIGKEPDEIRQARQTYLEAERRVRVNRLADQLLLVDKIAARDGQTPSTAPDPSDDGPALGRVAQAALKAAEQRITVLAPGSKERNDGSREFLVAFTRVAGIRGALQLWNNQLQAGGDITLEATGQFDEARGRFQGLTEGRTALEQLPETVERDEQILALAAATDGILGAVTWIDAQLELLKKNETYASFDSELGLVFWPDYPLLRWQANVLHYRFDGNDIRTQRPTLMVSRLEAPTLAITRRLVDDAIAVEKDGLQGKVYLDARGIPFHPDNQAQGSYGQYDQSLRELATILEGNSEFTIQLDNEGPLFQAGQCPDTAVYCGWYSLAKYVDAFDFNRGAVAYHLASAEATTLRDPQSEVWCKRLLEDGVCATIGPVHEPYLSAFPPPHEFFVLLGTGKVSLVEAYYRTKPFNSWVMVLVGDPLYRPFARRPLIDADSLPANLRGLLEQQTNTEALR